MRTELPLLVVGLGNPGRRYRDTRHNVGFLVVEEVARRLGRRFVDGTGPWLEAAGPGTGECGADGTLILLEPLTYMNLSGEAVAAWAAGRGLPLGPVDGDPEPAADPPLDGAAADPASDAASVPAADPAADPAAPPPTAPAPTPYLRPLVVCDDLALPLGAVRLRARGSSGGQKGLASVIAAVGHEDFPRLRLGIAPTGRTVAPADWPDFVLTPFAAAESEAVAEMVAWAADAVTCCREQGVEAAASRFNRR